MAPDDATLRTLLRQTRTIALVGHSHKPHRASYQIAAFLRDAGYRVYPVNPVLSTIDGELCYPTLNAIPDSIDLVNVFRRSEFLPEIAEAAIAIGAKMFWAQLGIQDDATAQRLTAAGITPIMDRCIKIEYLRLGLTPSPEAP
ncbi:MAG: CoA-binding protein [Synechococcales cyanobacterium T60_A2020_003]|nr:CoA-binding protein [Synechococcales cyanobacterium T60_A2020_003]